MWLKHQYIPLLVCLCACAVYSQTSTTPSPVPGRMIEMKKDDLILINVAAKGRVVELLANELARTEIIRALLVEYARECAENVTVLEKHCLDCMMDRCNNRMSECHIDGPPLKELISHSPSPIQGLQFLSKSPRDIDEGMKHFAKKARTDILQGVPETLREQSEAIMHSEVDQSLQDLDENINTERAIQKLSLHVQRAADNINKLPDVGDKLGTIIVANEDHAINLAELLARRLKDSRPFLDSINHNGARVIKQMPAVLNEVGQRVNVFKEKVTGVFNKVLNTFHKVMDEPETPVMNGNAQQQFRPQGINPNMPGMAPNMQGMNPNMQGMNPNMQGMNPNMQRMNVVPFPRQGIQGGQFGGQQPPQRRPQPFFNRPMQPQQPQQPFPSPPSAQGPWPSPRTQISAQMQFTHNGNIPNNQPISQLQNMNPTTNHMHPNAIPGSMPPTVQVQGQMPQGRRRRHTDADCQGLERDPDTYCRTYETLCHNCTLEKRLRFEVCGEGVEKARDEIKRMDYSVGNYLKAYEDYVANDKLVLKIELNTTNRLHKTNSFFDAFVTAKIGPSIFRYVTKMILNANDIRSTGLQIGDEIWEKLWENGVFEEARKSVKVPKAENIMGQIHIQQVHNAHAHSFSNSKQKSSAGYFGSSITVLFSTLLCLFIL